MNRSETLEALNRLTTEVKSLPDDFDFLDVETQCIEIHLNDVKDMRKIFSDVQLNPNNHNGSIHWRAKRNGISYIAIESASDEVNRLNARIKELEAETNPDHAIRDDLPESEAAAT